jgi:hypothetical protein
MGPRKRSTWCATAIRHGCGTVRHRQRDALDLGGPGLRRPPVPGCRPFGYRSTPEQLADWPAAATWARRLQLHVSAPLYVAGVARPTSFLSPPKSGGRQHGRPHRDRRWGYWLIARGAPPGGGLRNRPVEPGLRDRLHGSGPPRAPAGERAHLYTAARCQGDRPYTSALGMAAGWQEGLAARRLSLRTGSQLAGRHDDRNGLDNCAQRARHPVSSARQATGPLSAATTVVQVAGQRPGSSARCC